MRRRLISLGIRGDTIVEVLIVVTVLSMILATSYGVASRSQRANRQVEEHTQALKVAEGQLENLRAYPFNITDTKFCFTPAGQATGGFIGSSLAPNPANDDFESYPANCRQIPDGGSCNNYCYYTGISKGTGENANLYTVTVRWNGITGNRDQVNLYYRMPPK